MQDYLVQSGRSWILNPQSSLVQRLDCANGDGTTQYSTAIEDAQHELERNGRGNVQDVIVFLSDGAANTTPRFLPSYIDTPNNRFHPCRAGVKVATYAKSQGHDHLLDRLRPERLGHGPRELQALSERGTTTATITAWDAIRAIASDPANFYNKPNPGQLNTIFTRIAADLSRPAARLIDDDTP